MGVKTINNLTEITVTGETDNIPIVDNSGAPTTKRIKISSLKANFGGLLTLATVIGVNLKTTGLTLLYTVPAGKKLMVTDIVVNITNGDCAMGAVANIGFTNPDYDDIGLDLWIKASETNDYFALSSLSEWMNLDSGTREPKIVSAGTGLYLNITAAAYNGSNTVCVGDIAVIGYLI